MATLIQSPTRSGSTRKLGGAGVRQGAEARRAVETDARKAEPSFDSPPIGSTKPAPAQASNPATTSEAGLPKYDAESYTRMLENATQRATTAEAELSALKAQLEELTAKAREEGYSEGVAQGRAELDKQQAEHGKAFAQLLDSIQAEFSKSVLDAEESLVEIAYSAACRVIGGAAIDKNGVIALVRTACQSVLQRQDIIIHLSEHDYNQLKGSTDAILPDNAATHYEIVPDTRVKIGGCILETSTGSLDARLEIQLQRLKDAFLTARAKSLAGA